MMIKESRSPNVPVHKETAHVDMSGTWHRQTNVLRDDANEASSTKTYPIKDDDDDDDVIYSASLFMLLLVALVKIEKLL